MSKFGYNREQKKYPVRFQVAEGKFSRYTGRDTPPETLDVLQGILQGITLRNVEIDGRTTPFCDVVFRVEDGDLFSVSTIASSSITADIIGRLANLKDLNHIVVLSAWKNGQYNNIAMREKASWGMEDGEKMPFTQFPPVKKVNAGFQQMIDSSERDNAVMKIIDEINAKLKAIGVTYDTAAPAPANDPGDIPPAIAGPVAPPDYQPQPGDGDSLY